MSDGRLASSTHLPRDGSKSQPDPRESDAPMRRRSTPFLGALPYVAWAQALVATTGSLFFSEILGYPPCLLCWFQRVAMYPLVVILAVGILRRDQGVHLTVLPLSVIGLAIALYHNLLYIGVVPEAVSACRAGVSCTTRFFEWFGFITIPFLSLTAFTVITILMLINRRARPR